MQNATSLRDLLARSYSFEVGGKDFSLIPFSNLDVDDDLQSAILANWREEHIYAYPSRSLITVEGTKNWLSKAVLNNPHRMLFWISDSSMTRIGHIGLVYDNENSCLEIDNVLRGLPHIAPGLMELALLKIENIAEEEFSVDQIFLRVLESNHHAVNFYLKNGYSQVSIEELTWEGEGESKNLKPGLPKHDAFIRMSKRLQSQNGVIPNLILTAGPSISPVEIAYVNDAVANGWNSQHSDYLNKFEMEFAEFIGEIGRAHV